MVITEILNEADWKIDKTNLEDFEIGNPCLIKVTMPIDDQVYSLGLD